MTGPALDPRAVEAGARAIALRNSGGTTGSPLYAERANAEAALTAAAPFLRAEGAAAARQALADLIGELRGLCDGEGPPVWSGSVRAVIDRHDPEKP